MQAIEIAKIPQASPETFFSKLWNEVEPRNPLKKAFFISGFSLSCFRYFTVLINTITFIWTIATTPDEYTPSYFALLSYLTIWGFIISYLFSIQVIVWANAPDHSLKWKITYILGEVGFAMQLMICPFYFTVIFPIVLEKQNPTNWVLAFQILLHFVVPLLTWLGVLFSDIAFPKSHRIIINFVVVAYLLNNLAWTVLTKKPVYVPIDWVSVQSYVLKTLATVTIFGGFVLGGVIYQWKIRKTYSSFWYGPSKLV